MGNDVLDLIEEELSHIVGTVSARFLIWSISRDLKTPIDEINEAELRVICSQLLGLLEGILGQNGVAFLKNRVHTKLERLYPVPPKIW